MNSKPKIPIQLTKTQFINVIERTPLVSIDLIIRDSKNRILLGYRINEPAKDNWFVPGGRILKDETLGDAFERICNTEIDEKHTINEARFIGCFTHKYDTNTFRTKGISTHYVVLAYELRINKNLMLLSTTQHSKFRWFTKEEVDPKFKKRTNLNVHKYVVPYFTDISRMTDEQYQYLNTRRDIFNNLVWQTPVLSLTAQAFLFTIILSKDVAESARTVASVLSMITAIGSLQLLVKHRFMEKNHALLLQSYEKQYCIYPINNKFIPPNWIVGISSYKLWCSVLLIFLIAAFFSVLKIY